MYYPHLGKIYRCAHDCAQDKCFRMFMKLSQELSMTVWIFEYSFPLDYNDTQEPEPIPDLFLISLAEKKS